MISILYILLSISYILLAISRNAEQDFNDHLFVGPSFMTSLYCQNTLYSLRDNRLHFNKQLGKQNGSPDILKGIN